MENLLRKAFEVKDEWKVSVNTFCPHKILTLFFSNTGHKYNDCMTPEDSKLVFEYVEESTYSNLKSSFEQF